MSAKPPTTIIEAMDSVFASTFKRKLLQGDSWAPWKTFLRAFFALPMSDADREVYQKHTGRSGEPMKPFSEAFLICGRRSGKSRVASLIATYLSAFKNYDGVLSPGEQGVFMILSSDKRQSQVIFRYINAFFTEIPMLAKMVTNRTAEALSLANNVTVEVHSSNFRSVRGFTLIGAILDELAFFDAALSANPDREVLAALRPALATTGGPLLGISSPFSKKGSVYEAYREHYGKPSDVLVWKSPSRDMNPTLSRVTVAAAYLRDAASARAEYGAEFRDDVENFLSAETIEACTVTGRRSLPPRTGVKYYGFTDASGGRADSFSVAIAHREADREIIVLDLVHEITPPFSPESATREVVGILRQYHLSQVTGDHYAGSWVADAFTKLGISYQYSDLTRSEIYLEALPMFTSGTAELLDDSKLKTQLLGLERRASRGGRESVDHGVSGHDDLCNSACGVLVAARSVRLYSWVSELAREAKASAAAQSQPQPDDRDAQFQVQAAAGMAQAKASDVKVARVFGERLTPLPVAKNICSYEAKPKARACPKCGNKQLGQTCVPGISGDLELRCNCGWTEILKATTKVVAQS